VTVRDWLLYALLLLGVVGVWYVIVWAIVRGMTA
jgi:hypothetical protein